LILGESGTGKELIARAIHANSARSAGPFVAVDGGSLAETLLESELFGHERGSFTGAVASKKGLLEKAHLGTCFLDEVADLSPVLQGKLLRVIQEREIRRVGSTSPMTIDVRIVAASKKDLEQLVKAGTFREDLYYRLNVVTIIIPPLRERAEDIPLLTQYFIQMYGGKKSPPVTGISPEAMALLNRYWWPGNIRELQNFVERAVIMSTGMVLRPALGDLKRLAPAEVRTTRTLAEAERSHIIGVLRETNWVVGGLGGAAAKLGLSRTTLIHRMRKLGITRDDTNVPSDGDFEGWPGACREAVI